MEEVRYLFHETLDGTWSLKTDFAQDLVETPGVYMVSGDVYVQHGQSRPTWESTSEDSEEANSMVDQLVRRR